MQKNFKHFDDLPEACKDIIRNADGWDSETMTYTKKDLVIKLLDNGYTVIDNAGESNGTPVLHVNDAAAVEPEPVKPAEIDYFSDVADVVVTAPVVKKTRAPKPAATE